MDMGRKPQKIRCTYPGCGAWSKRGYDRCRHHIGKTPPGEVADAARSEPAPGVPPAGDKPLPTINSVIRDLAERQRLLSDYIEGKQGELSSGEIARLLGLHGQNAARLGRLLRDRRALAGESTDAIVEAIEKALDKLAADWGVEI
jgi:hypothetical protein